MTPEHDEHADVEGRDGPDAVVRRRVRRAVGFKVMRDLHREAREMERERRQRPWLVLRLLVLIGLLALALAAAVWHLYRGF